MLNAIYVYAWSGDASIAEKTAMISDDFKTVVDVWPGALHAVTACLDGLAEQLDVPTAALHLQPTLLDLRSR